MIYLLCDLGQTNLLLPLFSLSLSRHNTFFVLQWHFFILWVVVVLLLLFLLLLLLLLPLLFLVFLNCTTGTLSWLNNIFKLFQDQQRTSRPPQKWWGLMCELNYRCFQLPTPTYSWQLRKKLWKALFLWTKENDEMIFRISNYWLLFTCFNIGKPKIIWFCRIKKTMACI